jgi:uncharacterized protein (TIGR03437 family)
MRLLISFAILFSTGYGADFTTYVGGPTQNFYLATVDALAIDPAGNTYVTGIGGFVTKLDPTGNIIFTSTFSQGNAYPYESAVVVESAIAVDPAGNIWVGGTGFLGKMAPDGTDLYSSSFAGLLGQSGVTGIATDQVGNVYITGWTDASDYPTTPGLPASPVNGSYPNPIYGLFATKLDSTGQKILYSTVIAAGSCPSCFAGASKTVGAGIAVDGAGNALVAGSGSPNTDNLPAVTGASDSGAFVFKINAAGNAVVYFSYLGPTDVAQSIYLGTGPIATDASGNAYLAGYTYRGDFVAPSGTYEQAYPEAFAMKVDPTGATVWDTLLGRQSKQNTAPPAISLDSSDNVWLTGTIGTTSAVGPSFVAEMSADGSAVPFLAKFPLAAAGQDIAVDPSGVVHFAGPLGLVSTITEGQPLAPRALSIVNAASGQLSGTIAPGEIISIFGLGLGPTLAASANPQNGLFPTSLDGVQVLLNGIPIPLLYVSASQINAEIPSPLKGSVNGIASLQVVYNSITLPDFRLLVASSNFAVFDKPGGSMAVINQDGTLNEIENRAKLGSVVSIWATGLGATSAPADGAVASAANNYCSTCQLMLGSGTHYLTETAEYAGSSPGLIDGLTQINFMLPTDLYVAEGGAFVYFTPPGFSQPLLLGWVNVWP